MNGIKQLNLALAEFLGYAKHEISAPPGGDTVYVFRGSNWFVFDCRESHVYEPLTKHYGVKLTQLKGFRVDARCGDSEFESGARPWMAEFTQAKTFHREPGVALALALTKIRI